MTKLRQRLTYANVMSTVAVFIALGGSSYAALQIDSADIANNSVRGVDVRNRSLSERDFKRNALGGQEHPRVSPRSRAACSGGRSPRRDERGGPAAQVSERHVSDRRCLRRDHATASQLRMARRSSSARLPACRPDPDDVCRPTGSCGRRSAAVQLAPGGELTSEVYPELDGRESSTCCTSPTRSAASPSRRTPAPAARPSAASPTPTTENSRCEITPTRKESDVVSERPPAAAARTIRDCASILAVPSAAAIGSQAR